MTCRAIINATIDYGIDEDEREKILLEDIMDCLARKSVETARSIYAFLLNVHPERQELWLKVIDFEKTHGTSEQIDNLLRKAIDKCPQSEIFWLMAAKQKWKQRDVQGATAILQDAFAAHPHNENIYLAVAKLHRQQGQYDAARKILSEAREACNTPRVWMQSIQIERELKNATEAWKLCEEAAKKHEKFPKLWMIAGQLQLEVNNYEKARLIFERGIENNKNSVSLWICAIHLEEKLKNCPKARSIWEKARLNNPGNSDLWYTAIRLEEHDNNPAGSKYMLSRGLQECSKSGELWALSIEMEPKQLRNAKSVEALKHCDNDPYVILAVAKLFWKDRKYEKARKWLDRAIQINPDYGDAWIYYYKFETENGTPEAVAAIQAKCKEAEPKHGRLWISLSKQVENWRCPPDEILVKGARLIQKEFDIIE